MVQSGIALGSISHFEWDIRAHYRKNRTGYSSSSSAAHCSTPLLLLLRKRKVLEVGVMCLGCLGYETEKLLFSLQMS